LASLAKRAEAAVSLVANGELDPYTALALTVWPTERLEQVRPKRRLISTEEIERMVALAGEGRSHREIGELLGRPKATITAILRNDARAPWRRNSRAIG
jgi:hypothetical protein